MEKRDGGRCTFRDRYGRRCTKRHDLEFHHLKPFGLGGDHRPEGLALMCRLSRERHKRHYADYRIMPRRHARGARVAAIVSV